MTKLRALFPEPVHEEADERSGQGNERNGDGVSRESTNILYHQRFE